MHILRSKKPIFTPLCYPTHVKLHLSTISNLKSPNHIFHDIIYACSLLNLIISDYLNRLFLKLTCVDKLFQLAILWTWRGLGRPNYFNQGGFPNYNLRLADTVKWFNDEKGFGFIEPDEPPVHMG